MNGPPWLPYSDHWPPNIEGQASPESRAEAKIQYCAKVMQTIIQGSKFIFGFGSTCGTRCKFQAHYRNFRRRVKSFKHTASLNTWNTYPKRIITLQKKRLKLRVAIWAYSSSIEHNENKYKNQNISHKS